MLRVERLRKDYGDTRALKDIALHVPRGSIFGLIGPNGAGKSTFLRIVAAVLDPTYGRIFFDGKPADPAAPAYRHRIGFMPDFYLQYDALTVWQYLDYFAACHGLEPAARDRRIAELLEHIDLAGKRDALVEGLSRGMRQRLEFARAVVHEPDLLLLDEPASGLDPVGRKKLLELLHAERDRGRTVVISSHILPELAPVCTDIAIMEKGAVVYQGSVAGAASGLGVRRAVLLRVRDRLAEAQTIAARISGENAAIVSNAVRFLAADPDAVSARLVRELVGAGIDVVGIAPESSDLETVVSTLSRSEVS